MKSLNVFDDNELQDPRETRPLWVVLLVGSLLPGLGHFLLGKSRDGAALLLGSIAAQIALGVAVGLEIDLLYWIGLRAVTLLYLYSVVDAALLCAELRDHREGPDPRPRAVAFANLMLYGVGYWLLDRRGVAAVAIAFGIIIHALGGNIHPVIQLISEVGVLALMFHGYRAAEEDAADVVRSTGMTTRRRVADTTPGWLMPSLATFCGIQIVFVATATIVGNGLVAAMEVDQSKSLVVQPYYRNTEYGLQLEMNAPGWSFTQASPDEFVRARHVSEGTSMRLLMRPRLLGLPDSQTYAGLILGEALLQGYNLYEQSSEAVPLGGSKGWRLRAAGTRNGQPVEVEILTMGKSWRQYALWFEWESENASFGRSELNHLLASMELEGRSWGEPAQRSAR